MALKKDGELEMWSYCDVCDENIDCEMWVVDEEAGTFAISGLHLHFGGDAGEVMKLPPVVLEFPNHHIASRFKHKMELIVRAMREASGDEEEEEDD